MLYNANIDVVLPLQRLWLALQIVKNDDSE